MALININYESKTLGMPVMINAIIPQGRGSYKTLYLLHGMGGDYTTWITKSRVADYVDNTDIAVIMISGDNKCYVDNVHELMSISDLIITKPGGLTAAEALSKGLPMLIYRPIPGQEEANTRQLLQLGAAVQADTLCQLETRLVELLINNPQDLKRLSENAAAAGRANSALLVSQYIISLLEKLND